MPQERNQQNDRPNRTAPAKQNEQQRSGTGREQEQTSRMANRGEQGQDQVQRQNQEKRQSEQKTGPHGGTRNR